MIYKFVDLFSGAGGLSEGFRQAGFQSVYAVEIDKAAAATYERNFNHEVFSESIQKLKKLPVKPDIIIGGPPCQGFSPLGQMSPSNGHSDLNQLWRHYMRLVKESQPEAFVMENVPEILKSEEFRQIEATATRLGYQVASGVLNAAEFGVPQARRRAFIIGLRRGIPFLPDPVGKRVTVRDAIGDLPITPTGQDWHIGRAPTYKSLLRYRCIPPGGNRFDLVRRRPDIAPRCWIEKKTGSTDVFGRLEWDKPALTIRTEFFKPEKGRYLHPKAHRPITHREAARLQTFPDTFQFVGSKIQVAKQIGNAVPPVLAKHIAAALLQAITKCQAVSNG